MCLAGTTAPSWFLTQEIAGSNPYTVMTNILISEISEFNYNSQEKIHDATTQGFPIYVTSWLEICSDIFHFLMSAIYQRWRTELTHISTSQTNTIQTRDSQIMHCEDSI